MNSVCGGSTLGNEYVTVVPMHHKGNKGSMSAHAMVAMARSPVFGRKSRAGAGARVGAGAGGRGRSAGASGGDNNNNVVDQALWQYLRKGTGATGSSTNMGHAAAMSPSSKKSTQKAQRLSQATQAVLARRKAQGKYSDPPCTPQQRTRTRTPKAARPVTAPQCGGALQRPQSLRAPRSPAIKAPSSLRQHTQSVKLTRPKTAAVHTGAAVPHNTTSAGPTHVHTPDSYTAPQVQAPQPPKDTRPSLNVLEQQMRKCVIHNIFPVQYGATTLGLRCVLRPAPYSAPSGAACKHVFESRLKGLNSIYK